MPDLTSRSIRFVLAARAYQLLGKPTALAIEAVDADGRPVEEFTGTVRLHSRRRGVRLPAEVTFTAGDRGCKRAEGVIFSTVGTHRLSAVDARGEAAGESLPLIVRADLPRYELLWGDLHVHSRECGCGSTSAEDCYRYARDRAGLDFCAVTPHDRTPDCGLDGRWELWDEVRQAAAAFHEPERFVTFAGYEWAGGRDGPAGGGWGHRNVMYLGDGPLLSGGDPATSHLEGLWAALEGRSALCIPHHPAAALPRGCVWDHHFRHPELEPLVEVYSSWGSSEGAHDQPRRHPIIARGGEQPRGLVGAALRQGYVIGFVGGGDTRDGRPGRGTAAPTAAEPAYPAGLMGVWALKLTREELWKAMHTRRTFATTGARIIVEFSVGSAPMGSDLVGWPGTGVSFLARVIGTADILEAVVVRDGEDAQRVPGRGPELEFDWTWSAQPGQPHTYYLRVVQVDGHMAWSSPIYMG